MTQRKLTSPKCECGADFCNRKMVLNGVQFVCENGQSTLSEHSSHWPIYSTAPQMLKALKKAEAEIQRLRDVLLPEYEGKIGEPRKGVLLTIRRAIKNATEQNL